MVTEISTDVPKEIVPLAWLLGSWAGSGVLGYPDRTSVNFGQVVTFSHSDQPYLEYSSTMWELDEAGNRGASLGGENGYWRVALPDDIEAAAKAAPGVDVEVVLAHPQGVVEVYLGRSSNGRIDLATDVAARTGTAEEYKAGQRMYGLVKGDLFWALDLAVRGHSLQSYASARLKKLSDELTEQDAIAQMFQDGPRA